MKTKAEAAAAAAAAPADTDQAPLPYFLTANAAAGTKKRAAATQPALHQPRARTPTIPAILGPATTAAWVFSIQGSETTKEDPSTICYVPPVWEQLCSKEINASSSAPSPARAAKRSAYLREAGGDASKLKASAKDALAALKQEMGALSASGISGNDRVQASRKFDEALLRVDRELDLNSEASLRLALRETPESVTRTSLMAHIGRVRLASFAQLRLDEYELLLKDAIRAIQRCSRLPARAAEGAPPCDPARVQKELGSLLQSVRKTAISSEKDALESLAQEVREKSGWKEADLTALRDRLAEWRAKRPTIESSAFVAASEWADLELDKSRGRRGFEWDGPSRWAIHKLCVACESVVRAFSKHYEWIEMHAAALALLPAAAGPTRADPARMLHPAARLNAWHKLFLLGFEGNSELFEDARLARAWSPVSPNADFFGTWEDARAALEAHR